MVAMTGFAHGSAPERPYLAVLCLGRFEVVVDGRPIASWGSGKARALFQYLVNHPNRPLGREQLIEALWPDPDAEAAGTSLRVAVHALRRLLSSAAGEQAGLSIQGHASGYQLAVADLWLDVAEFERHGALGRQLLGSGHPTEAEAQYRRAVELYRGDFLAGSSEAWVALRREGLKDQYLFALERLAEAAWSAGDYQGCVLRCQQLLRQDACRESTYRTLMLCHARLGQRGRVRSWYELCVQTLRTELGVSPEGETAELYRRAVGAAS
jgi:DNA-binding SARP family transcriptional activator